MKFFATEYRVVYDYSYNKGKWNTCDWLYIIQYRKWWMMKWRILHNCVRSKHDGEEIITKYESK